MERTFCDKVIISQHNRFKCWRCRRQISKGLPVVRMGESTNNHGYQTHSICYKCANQRLEQDKEEVKDATDRYNEIIKDFEKAMNDCSNAITADKLIREEREEKARKEEEAQRKIWEENQKRWEKEREEYEEKRKQEIIDEYLKSQKNKSKQEDT